MYLSFISVLFSPENQIHLSHRVVVNDNNNKKIPSSGIL